MDFFRMGNFLRLAREKLGLSQETVAAVINISDRNLRNIEYGLVDSSFLTIIKLCDLYGLPICLLCQFYERDPDMIEAIKIYHIKDTHRFKDSISSICKSYEEEKLQ